MSLLEAVNSGALLAVVGLLFRNESRLMRIETIVEILTNRKPAHG